MNKLIINTANDELFVVLTKDNFIFSKSINAKMHHNETMLPLIDELLKENSCDIADIDEFGVIIGPGSFTGIRVGISTIKAFRDANKVTAKGINNLDYLFNLANNQNKEIETVAILGSKDSYFVAKLINGIVYKYERNLTLNELIEVAENKPIGMFKQDENLNCIVFENNAEILVNCYNNSADKTLVPVYYQLSQAENEKLKKGKLEIVKANADDLNLILNLEKQNILVNTLAENDIDLSLNDVNYITYKALFNNEVVGFIIGQISDEINIVSIAVDKEYRNLGIATKLVNTLMEHAKNNGINAISLEVAYTNITAYLLYKKLGFTLRRTRKNYYADGTDCLEMFKKV